MEWFDVNTAEAIGDAQRSYYQQRQEKIDLRRHSSTRACEWRLGAIPFALWQHG